MTASAPSLAELKKLIGAIDGSEERQRRSFAAFPHGFVVGTVSEVAGIGKVQFVAEFLKAYPELTVAWVEPEISINPYSLWQYGVNLSNVTFVETQGEYIWSLQQVLQSQVFDVIVVSDFARHNYRLDEKDLRRFQLLVEKSEAHLFLLSEFIKPSWIPALQVKVEREEASVQAQIIKQRGYA